jgi:uncharacterized protein
MGKPRKPKAETFGSDKPLEAHIQNAVTDLMRNGLASAIGYGATDFPANQGSPFSMQISQVNTLQRNLRYYLISNFRQMLSEAYVEIGLIQALVDVPVDDAFRGGIMLKSRQLDEDEIKQLRISMDRDGDLTTANLAMKWNRLFGGAGTIVMTDQDPMEPLDLDSLDSNTNLEFRAADMWELFWDKQNTEGYDPTTQTEDFEYYSYYGERVHKSRVMRLKGITAPSFIRPRLRGWGFSVVETLVRSLNQYLKGTDLLFEVLDEFKVDVYKIKNLTNTLMSPIGEEAVKRRVQMANWQKNYQNALTMDSEDDWDHKQLSFAGLGDAMEQVRMQVAADMRFPMLKLFGTPARGLNASDEDSIEVYNSMVEGQVREKIKYQIIRMAEIKCQVLFGFIPDDLELEWQPLRMMSAEQQENVKTQKFTRALQTLQAGQISPEEFRDICNKGNLFDVPLDTSINFDDMADIAAEGQNNPKDPKDTDDPGTDRLDTRKARAVERGGLSKVGPKQKTPKTEATKPEDRAKATNIKNSAAFDKASYAADGGDDWIDSRREYFFDGNKAKDQTLWRQCVGESGGNWKFAVWMYEKQGGKWA